MSTVDAIIAVASWEPRFVLGVKRLTEEVATQRFLMYYYEERSFRTADARAEAKRICEARKIEVSEVALRFAEPARTWARIQGDLCATEMKEKEMLVDITTMPRETIWATLFWLQASSARIRYAYHRPERYGKGWLARDPDVPRFAFKLAGTPDLDRATALVAVTGFDPERAIQAIEFFEPARVVLGVQTGIQFGNCERNVDAYKGGVFARERTTKVEIDAYANDHGYSVLRKSVESLISKFNVILCSFGPKLSAIALFRLQQEFPQSALAHIQCRDYSPEYSTGIGHTIQGRLPAPSPSSSG